MCDRNNSPNPPPIQVNLPHKDQISSFMHQFVENVVVVVGDGHCGLCVVAGLRGMYANDHHVNGSGCYLLMCGIKNQFNVVKNAMSHN